jgi:hypothetical protein
MELGTFGAILRFALTLEEQAAAFYQQAAPGEHAELFRSLEQVSRARLKTLQRARQEGVAEMILESIHGLDGDAYRVELSPNSDPARQALALEEAAARFYGDAAAKMPIPEIRRLFGRLAKENEERKAKLGSR